MQFTPEQAEQSQQEIQAALQEANLPPSTLIEIGQWAQRVIENPQEFPAFQQWLRSQGLDEEDIPQEPDYQELTAMVAMSHVAQSLEPAPAANAAPSGPVSPEQLQSLAQAGTYGDTQLAHINPQEAAMLQSMGGSATINPQTGLPQYNFFSDLWRGIKKVAKKVGKFVLPVVAIAFPALLPAIGTALGASAALAPIVGAAAVAGGVTALSGGSMKEILTSAAITGLGAYLTPIVGKYVGGTVGITNPALTSAIGSATLAGGMTALRGGTVSQILTAAATGAAANYLGTVASNAINSGAITNTRITQKPFDDSVYIGADAKGLADAGLGKNQITEILMSTGVPSQIAATAANAAVSGATADGISVVLSNTYGASKTLYSNNATGVQKSIIGGGNVKSLESVQRAEDALFVAEDAQNLKAAGLNEAAIAQNLQAQGVPPDVAKMAAAEVTRGATLDATAQSVVYASNRAGGVIIGEPTGVTTTTGGSAAEPAPAPAAAPAPAPAAAPAPISPEQQARIADAEFLAADAAQLRAQGLGQDQIQQTLVSSGATQNAAYQAAMGAARGQSVDVIANSLANQRFDLFSPGGRTEAELIPGGGQGAAQPQSPGEIVEVDVSQPANLGGNVTEAEFIAADAAQLAQQTNNNTAAIQQNLEYAGVDPVVAAEAANLAASGVDAATIAATIGGTAGPTGVPTTGGSLFTNEPGAFTSQGLGAPVGTTTTAPTAPTAPDTSLAAELENQPDMVPTDPIYNIQPQQPPPGVTGPGYDVGAIVATPPLTDTTPLTPTPPARPDMGTFTPASPDPSWSQPLQYPGMNPGLVGAGIRPAYQTTSPVQSQYYWGRQPFFAQAEDLQNYNTSPYMPAQPWGIQQGYFEMPPAYAQTPVFGANMQPIAPADMPTAAQIGGSQPLNQPIPVQAAVAPYEVSPYVLPNMLPYNMYQLPTQPNYVYNIAPQAAQYSVPAAAPVTG